MVIVDGVKLPYCCATCEFIKYTECTAMNGPQRSKAIDQNDVYLKRADFCPLKELEDRVNG